MSDILNTPWFRLPYEWSVMLPCEWQQTADLISFALCVVLIPCIALCMVQWLVKRWSSDAENSRPRVPMPVRKWHGTAAVTCGSLAVLGLCLPQLLYSQDVGELPVPMVWFMALRWMAAIPLLMWCAGLLNTRLRRTAMWSYFWTYLSSVCFVVAATLINASSFLLGCII